MPQKSFFITFEGTDGVGKSTQAQRTAQWLQTKGIRVLLTREPGGGPVAEQVRTLLLDPQNKMHPMTELLLYQAARVEHIRNVIQPELKKGVWVLCDRFTDATLAYQGRARGLWNESVTLNKLVCGKLKPHLTILFDHPTDKALKKAQARRTFESGDRMEQEGQAFQEKVRKGYLWLARREPRRIRLIRVRPTIEETQSEVQKIIGALLHGHTRTTPRP